MFSFHKPKVYRSPTGCCICKAKSSSSRFTDSRKYEDDFVECFQLSTPRRGEICNACVLLVKRFKRLPQGSDRHWGHVVDARVGPGLKSMTKFKKKKEEKESAAAGGPPPEKFLKIMKKKSKKLREQCLEARENSPVLSEEGMDGSIPGSPLSSHSEPEDSIFNAAININRYASEVHRQQARKYARKSRTPCKRKRSISDDDSFLQTGYWQSMKTCCGAAFRGQGNELAIDLSRYKPCAVHSKMTKVIKKPKLSMPLPPIVTSWPPVVAAPQTTEPTDSTDLKESKVFSDNSSDSGYDDCSNIDKPHAAANTNQKSAAELSIISDPEVSKKLDMEKSVNLLNLEKGVVLVGGPIKNNLSGFKKNFVLNRSIKPNTIKVNTANLMKPNNIVIIKPKSVTSASCVVKSQGPVSNINQVQQAAN